MPKTKKKLPRLKKDGTPYAKPKKPRKTGGLKVGRKPADLDPEVIQRLAEMHCTNVEIASVVGCDIKTLTRRFGQELDKGRESGKARLRRLQWASAERGNVAMLIFLGKNLLRQSDRHELTGANGADLIPDTEPAALAARIQELLERGRQRANETPG